MDSSGGFEAVARKRLSISKLGRRAKLAPATQELQETFALRRILLKHGQKTEEECQSIRRFLAQRTTMWREPFWALLARTEQLKVAQCVKLRMVATDGEPHDVVAADSASGCMVFACLKGLAQVQCFDSTGTRLGFQPSESFGFLPVPDFLMEEATRNVEAVKANPNSKVYRGEREYTERREAVNEAGKIRVKIAPGGQYLSISGADVLPMLKNVAEKQGRIALMKSMGLERPGGGAGGGGGGGGEGGGGRKREPLMREARYGVGSVLVEEGEEPTMVYVVVEGECRIVKGKPGRSHSAVKKGAKPSRRSARYNLGSGRGSKVGVVLTSGFHTQVDVRHLGSLGPKALVGDIPVLLGGVQPASIVAKTPLRMLQCKAEKFAAHLDHNIRAKMVYVEAAKARKARMQERGAEVENLLSLGGTPLLVDVHAATAATTPSNELRHSGSNLGGTGTAVNETCTTITTAAAEGLSADAADVNATYSYPSDEKTPRGNETFATRTRSKIRDRAVGDIPVEAATATTAGSINSSNDGKEVKVPRMPDSTSKEDNEEEGTEREPGCEGPLDAERLGARISASTPLLPCFSMGSRLASRGPRGGAFTGGHGTETRSSNTNNLKVSASAGELSATTTHDRARAMHWRGESATANRAFDAAAVAAMEGKIALSPSEAGGLLMERSSSSSSGGDVRELAISGGRAGVIVAAARGNMAEELLASHLTPFPTITKNRSLHAVSQPIVPHSEGFKDACRGESSRLGTAAWRVARAARFDGLVTPAERESIARQIEAGFETLQSRRRVSPVA